MVTDMSEQQESYKEIDGKTVASKLNRLSIERIKNMGKHWEETYGS